MRTFVFNDGKSNKFWNIELDGSAFTVTFGKVGTKGQSQKKGFGDATKARAAHDKIVAEKLGKGYVETTAAAPAPPAPLPLQAPLEAALVEHPDEVAAHSAYADYLAEEGDPRGEFIQTQLALEETGRSAAERKQLQAREKELLKLHAREWLGDLGRFLVGNWSGEDKPYHYHFARGWLDYLRVLPFPEAMIDALAAAPETRLLRMLDVVYDMRYHPHSFFPFTNGPEKAVREGEEAGAIYDMMAILPRLIRSPHLTNLRAFKFGFSDTGPELLHSTMVDPFGGCSAQQVLDFLAKCPRLEELYLNTTATGIDDLFKSRAIGNLRVLQYYYGDDYASDRGGVTYPLSTLAKNRALRNVTTLKFHPGREATLDLDEVEALLRSPHLPNLRHLQLHMTTFGDDVCPLLLQSGILKRLKTLDLGYGNMTDDGARQLAASADAKNLEVLDLSRNALTARGVSALKKAGVRVLAEAQHAADDEEYLYQVDAE